MPYPLQFRPNAQVSIYNQAGAIQVNDIAAQFFKPLIGTTANDFTRPVWGPQQMSMRAVSRCVFQWGGTIPTSPSGDVGGSWLLRTLGGGAPYQTFLIAGGFRWDDSYYWLILAQL